MTRLTRTRAFRRPSVCLGQAGPGADEIQISSTADLFPGDFFVITFPLLSAGFTAYGSTEKFIVTGFEPGTGRVLTVDESGEAGAFEGGSRENLLARLRERTRFSSVRVFRPQAPAAAFDTWAPEPEFHDVAFPEGPLDDAVIPEGPLIFTPEGNLAYAPGDEAMKDGAQGPPSLGTAAVALAAMGLAVWLLS